MNKFYYKTLRFLKDKWWIFALVFIFLFSYHIRAINIVPDRLLSFDPIFQYRFTKYFVEWGHLPVWDELSYYVGRAVAVDNVPPFMFYLTSIFYSLLKGFGFSLMTVAAYASAIYGALIVIPAFLLGRELSNKYGGLMSAILVGTAPQILIRTFGSSYDTDQLVLFFMILTIYLGIYALRKKTFSSVCLAIIGFTAYMLTWWMFLYSLIIVIASIIVYFVLSFLLKRRNDKIKLNLSEKLKLSLKEIKSQVKIIILIIIGLFFTNLILTNFNFGLTIFEAFNALVGFAQQAEAWIVNISIAELQPFSILNPQGWSLAMGRFITGIAIIDNLLFVIFVVMLIVGIINSYKKDLRILSFLITLFLIATVTATRGIRFTEFSSAFFLVLIGIGFGNFIEWSKKDNFLKALGVGLCILVALVAFDLGFQLGKGLGPDINPNWDSAWDFLKTKTPEDSIIGTWWDPGHMITGLAERRVIGDGAHCGWACKYTINDRITDLGKIMATNDENESLELIRKYQGNSPKAYWIASDDLIGKWRWPQYFGTGCDGTTDTKCPLYYQIPYQSNSFDQSGNLITRNYGNVFVDVYHAEIPIPIFVEGINAALFDEIIIYNNTDAIPIRFTDEEKEIILTGLKPLEGELNIRFTNQTMPLTVWVPRHYSYIVLIPPYQRNNVFTKMFFLEGLGLEHFKQVFRNEQVKIYEVI